ncbi:hypothetical protein BOTBODRAFT_60734 [Botryobasidium botryosum FD-172 SS1]|uniref:Uncharacterized protein n=1 Tax=Botryobasidium botryosum (strain FD-172 SS1) TaxID=930990 RepID=A0A067M3M0_BOTB1|nr:hypothetical protein BOTBODRAFT_60734 [Botryobasidium botryosum FD-172 SS1]
MNPVRLCVLAMFIALGRVSPASAHDAPVITCIRSTDCPDGYICGPNNICTYY